MVSGTWRAMNGNNDTMVAMCWTPISGYSSFGEYTGNGNVQGPFINTGMRVGWVMVKRTDDSGAWLICDTTRTPDNPQNVTLSPNSANAQATGVRWDSLSNGFKLRNTGGAFNESGATYAYFAFADSPQGGSNVQPATAR